MGIIYEQDGVRVRVRKKPSERRLDSTYANNYVLLVPFPRAIPQRVVFVPFLVTGFLQSDVETTHAAVAKLRPANCVACTAVKRLRLNRTVVVVYTYIVSWSFRLPYWKLRVVLLEVFAIFLRPLAELPPPPYFHFLLRMLGRF